MPRRYRQSPLITRHGRRQQLTSINHRNIYRYRYGYYVNKMFMRHQYRAYFSCIRYGGSYKAALRAAIVERDWLDANRRRILDRLQVMMVRAALPKRGRRRVGALANEEMKKKRKDRGAVSIREVVKMVVREMGAKMTWKELRDAPKMATESRRTE